jgi:GTP 3',8-cyclase
MFMPNDTFPNVRPQDPTPGPNYAYWGGSNLYVNLTSRCSAACKFCIHNFTWDIFGYDLRLAPGEEPDTAEVFAAVQRALTERAPLEVVFTGLGEPTMRLDVLTGSLAAVTRLGLRTRLDTNGHGKLINPGRDVVAELRVAGLNAVSVSLNAHDEATYESLCHPSLAGAFPAVLEFIKACVSAGLETTATVVDLTEVDKVRAASLATALGARFRVRSLVTGEKVPE